MRNLFDYNKGIIPFILCPLGEAMVDIDTLIKENRTNHYKLLTIVGNNKAKINSLIIYLKERNWAAYDVEKIVLELIETIPEDKIKLRIGTELKKWIKNTEDNVILYNANILYSPEMDKIGPFSAFKYNMRGKKEGILFMDGKIRGDVVVYSIPGRPDYHERELSDVLSIELEKVDLPEVK
ncbi:hypothetical protein MBGDN05_00444 [Thermoplasmatales archaeon SCGC AB-539-N05]|nr:hypothetical protein MBGDN05_00444 [Thermoplasmatales archaeon SCGC AB-539-N05]